MLARSPASFFSQKDRDWMLACECMASIMQKCSKRAYYCFILDVEGFVIGTGYNGTPKGMANCTDGGCPRARNNVPSGTPYDFGEGLCFSNHAEANALMTASRQSLMGSTLYVNGICCVNCAKLIANTGVTRVVCQAEERDGSDVVEDIFRSVGITLVVM